MLVLEGVEKRYGAAARARRAEPRGRRGRAARRARAVGLGQVDGAARRRRAGAPDAGRVLVGGRDVTHEPPARRDVAMVFQSFALFPHLTVRENIGFGLAARRTPAAERERRVREAAEVLELGDAARRAGRTRCRAASASASRSRARSPAARRCCSWTSRCRTSTRRCASGRARRSAGCTARSGRRSSTSPTTRPRRCRSAERVAVLEGGRLRQVGEPDEVYERPGGQLRRRLRRQPADEPRRRARRPAACCAARGRSCCRCHGGRRRRPTASACSPASGRRGRRAPPAAATAAGSFPARLDAVERAGHERLWYLERRRAALRRATRGRRATRARRHRLRRRRRRPRCGCFDADERAGAMKARLGVRRRRGSWSRRTCWASCCCSRCRRPSRSRSSLTDYDLFSAPSFAGLDNFGDLLDDPAFRAALPATLAFLALAVPLRVAGALAPRAAAAPRARARAALAARRGLPADGRARRRDRAAVAVSRQPALRADRRSCWAPPACRCPTC